MTSSSLTKYDSYNNNILAAEATEEPAIEDGGVVITIEHCKSWSVSILINYVSVCEEHLFSKCGI